MECTIWTFENDLHKGQVADYVYLDPARGGGTDRSGRAIAEINPSTGTIYYLHTDTLGTPHVATDSGKNVVWSATYNPFGDTRNVTGTLTTQSLRLPGQQFDPETGYSHNGFRDYAGALTRYVESDPIGLRGGSNTYQYVLGNPFKYVDRLGLASQSSACPTNVGPIICTMDAPPVSKDRNFPNMYQPDYNFGGVGTGPADPDNPNGGDVKWVRYNCNYENGGYCSFIGPGNGDDGYGVQTETWSYEGTSETVPVYPGPFVVDPSTDQPSLPFIKAMRNNRQCMQ